jgi:hypothetical protein
MVKALPSTLFLQALLMQAVKEQRTDKAKVPSCPAILSLVMSLSFEEEEMRKSEVKRFQQSFLLAFSNAIHHGTKKLTDSSFSLLSLLMPMPA